MYICINIRRNSELEHFPLMAKNAGQSVEKAIFDKVQSKNHYLGYSAKIILSVRNMGKERLHNVRLHSLHNRLDFSVY